MLVIPMECISEGRTSSGTRSFIAWNVSCAVSSLISFESVFSSCPQLLFFFEYHQLCESAIIGGDTVFWDIPVAATSETTCGSVASSRRKCQERSHTPSLTPRKNDATSNRINLERKKQLRAVVQLPRGSQRLENLESHGFPWVPEECENLGTWLNNFSEHKRSISHRIGSDTRWKRPQNAYIPGRETADVGPTWVFKADPKHYRKYCIYRNLLQYIK